ncbi:hypothetical protein BX600DRAFT_461977 [Xylariales sp. PMI_506]|nr:hypothetical protein BX600DRAFT_461977 [Xylariales sp. PMI_506]
MAMEITKALKTSLQYLLREDPTSARHDWGYQDIRNISISSQLEILRQLLCVRSPTNWLPSEVSDSIEEVLNYVYQHRLLTEVESLETIASVPSHSKRNSTNLHLWRGDITTLSGVTAITNAANSQMLGCFQPGHRCIDNIIHSWAGPAMRHECYEIMSKRGSELETDGAIVTKGYCLPAPFVVHAVGPQLRPGNKPTDSERRKLAQCYTSILKSAESLPTTSSTKSVALCCISTGLFAFPAQEAAQIAVESTISWLQARDSTITDIIFNTFTESDTEIYHNLLIDMGQTQEAPHMSLGSATSMDIAREWLGSADAILVTAGAGLSASDGLDYTSAPLFQKYFPGFLKYGLKTLYSVFGFSGWTSEQDRWGYYFTHLGMIKGWPESSMYKHLISWLKKQAGEVHIRTSNADGLFLANGWNEEQLSTPQGRYSVLQCLANCRPDAFVPTQPLLDAALPWLDPVTQTLTNSSHVPVCQYCGSKMNICVRAADWFNERPFRAGEQRWRQFRQRTRSEKKNLVILELGVGNSTPGVLKWPNEDMVEKDEGRTKLIRIGLGFEATVPLELETRGWATYIDGDLKKVLSALCS